MSSRRLPVIDAARQHERQEPGGHTRGLVLGIVIGILAAAVIVQDVLLESSAEAAAGASPDGDTEHAVKRVRHFSELGHVASIERGAASLPTGALFGPTYVIHDNIASPLPSGTSRAPSPADPVTERRGSAAPGAPCGVSQRPFPGTTADKLLRVPHYSPVYSGAASFQCTYMEAPSRRSPANGDAATSEPSMESDAVPNASARALAVGATAGGGGSPVAPGAVGLQCCCRHVAPLPEELAKRDQFLANGLAKTPGATRCLPQVTVIGAQKSGSTALMGYLLGHPNFVSSYQKEVHFFDRAQAWVEGIAKYIINFREIGDLIERDAALGGGCHWRSDAIVHSVVGGTVRFAGHQSRHAPRACAAQPCGSRVQRVPDEGTSRRRQL